jgi:hypothetical protein
LHNQSEELNRFGLHKNETMKYAPTMQFVIELEERKGYNGGKEGGMEEEYKTRVKIVKFYILVIIRLCG